MQEVKPFKGRCSWLCTFLIFDIKWDHKYRRPNGSNGLSEEKSYFGDGGLAQKVVYEDLDGLWVVLNLEHRCQHSQHNTIMQVKAIKNVVSAR